MSDEQFTPEDTAKLWKKLLPFMGVLVIGWVTLNLLADKQEPESTEEALQIRIDALEAELAVIISEMGNWAERR